MKFEFCTKCGSKIESSYLIEISMLKNRNNDPISDILAPIKLNSIYYHINCYEEIAGKEYVEKLEYKKIEDNNKVSSGVHPTYNPYYIPSTKSKSYFNLSDELNNDDMWKRWEKIAKIK